MAVGVGEDVEFHGWRAGFQAACAEGGYFLFNTSVNTPFASLLCSNSCPVWWQNAAKSAGAPGSVARMVRVAPLSKVARAFLARRMGSGHFKPVKSRVCMGFPWCE